MEFITYTLAMLLVTVIALLSKIRFAIYYLFIICVGFHRSDCTNYNGNQNCYAPIGQNQKLEVIVELLDHALLQKLDAIYNKNLTTV